MSSNNTAIDIKQPSEKSVATRAREITFKHTSPLKGENELKEYLNSLLANEFTVFTKTLNYHWNVTGPRFHSIHEFLETQYRDLLEIIDDVAERIRNIDGNPIGTVKEVMDMTTIPERPKVYPPTSEMIADLMMGHEALIKQIKAILEETQKRFDDPATEDFLTGLLKKHEESAWMLKSHLD